jgi:ATP-dependent DNA helicase DinG
LSLGSPFDFERQATLYVAVGLPDPATQPQEFEEAAIRAIPQFIRKTHGKALVLFTSNRMMAEASRLLGPWFEAEGITLLAQSSGLSRDALLNQFRSDVDSVLFGTDSFWHGVDVPADALSSVIITRLPFEVPTHPQVEARLERVVQQGGDRFWDHQVPEAILKFKQGVGRLIRSRSDRGIIVILDPRVRTKAYGQTFLRTIPRCRTVVEEVPT